MDNTTLPTLYHGTDARIVKMTSGERKAYADDCNQIIDYLYPFLETDPQRMGKLIGDEHLDKYPLFWKAFVCVGGYKNKNAQYQYGSFYLTNMKDRAVAYAYNSFAGGGVGADGIRVISGRFEDRFRRLESF